MGTYTVIYYFWNDFHKIMHLNSEQECYIHDVK